MEWQEGGWDRGPDAEDPAKNEGREECAQEWHTSVQEFVIVMDYFTER
jgi:hypothetical protein